MNKQETIQYLKDKNINFELTEHEAVFNMEEVGHIELPHPEADAKNLFIKDSKGQYYLITVRGNKRVNLKEFRMRHGLKNPHFASDEELMEILGLIPGAVTPLGLLNDKELRTIWFLDKSFENGLIGVHPNDNTATVWLLAEDLIKLIQEHGNRVEITELK